MRHHYDGMMSAMTSYRRTQVYLDPEDHRRLKRLAAERDQSMTDLVREAVARYIAGESSDEVPSVEEMMTQLSADPLYEGLPGGSEGFISRMRARADAAIAPSADLRSADRELGEALLDEHAEHVRVWERRQDADHLGRDRAPR